MNALRLRAALAAASAAVLLAACGGSGFDSVSAPKLFSTVVVFGASTADAGNACNANAANCPPSPPYTTGRFSDGITYAERLAAGFGAAATPSRLGGTNYAFAGARTGTVPGASATTAPSMVAQVNQYLAAVNYQVNPQHLVVLDVVTFGNNVAVALTEGLNTTAVVTQGVTDLVGMINQLYAAGARHILVANAPNIGRTPRIQLAAATLPPAVGAQLIGGATAMAQGFNQNIAAQIAGLRQALPGANIYLFDVYALETSVVANPSSFGLTNVTTVCFNAAVNPPTVCATPATWFYWDTFHPTAAVHNVLAQRAVALLPKP